MAWERTEQIFKLRLMIEMLLDYDKAFNLTSTSSRIVIKGGDEVSVILSDGKAICYDVDIDEARDLFKNHIQKLIANSVRTKKQLESKIIKLTKIESKAGGTK